MGGGLMQLVAYGAQDIYLTGNPQITYFKTVYQRHTNFAVEQIEQTFNGTADYGKKVSCTISRNGDLLYRVYLECDMSIILPGENEHGVYTSTNSKILKMKEIIDYVEIEIGGQIIDKHYGEWIDIWLDLTHTKDKKTMLERMTALPSFTNNNHNEETYLTKIYIPLQFWFCKNPGLAIPLIALQYHEVKINIKFHSDPIGPLVNNTAVNINVDIYNISVFCDYIFLDTDERRLFAQVSHEYLIEQVQYSNQYNIGSMNISLGAVEHSIKMDGQCELRFNHPVKEIIWLLGQQNSDTSITTDITVDSALLQLNGNDRFQRRNGTYFTIVQRYQHHSGVLGVDMNNSIHIYSFALKPEEHQPSGTCNFSRIDNTILTVRVSNNAGNGHNAVRTDTNFLRVYAVNYNVLRIMSGMGGLAYSN